MATNPFPTWLPEVVAHPVVIQPDDISIEALGNLWSFSLSREQAAAVSVADVEEFAAGVAEAHRATLEARGAGTMVLYWWHDEQAGQLRFSLVSRSHGQLPFGCQVVSAPSIRDVIRDWLSSPTLFGIPLTDDQSLDSDEPDDEAPSMILPVYSQLVP